MTCEHLIRTSSVCFKGRLKLCCLFPADSGGAGRWFGQHGAGRHRHLRRQPGRRLLRRLEPETEALTFYLRDQTLSCLFMSFIVKSSRTELSKEEDTAAPGRHAAVDECEDVENPRILRLVELKFCTSCRTFSSFLPFFASSSVYIYIHVFLTMLIQS